MFLSTENPQRQRPKLLLLQLPFPNRTMPIIINKLLFTDYWLTSFCYHLLPHRSGWFNFFLLFSPFLNIIFFWLSILLLVVWLAKKDQLVLIWLFLLSLGITGYLVNYPLKNTFQRQRPLNTVLGNDRNIYFLWQNSSEKLPSDYSFPSGHAAISFAAATVLTNYLLQHKRSKTKGRKVFEAKEGSKLGLNLGGLSPTGLSPCQSYQWGRFWSGWLFFAAVLVAYSRIYLGVHYLADVAVGALIGWLVSQTVDYGFRKVQFRWQQRHLKTC
jgi:membrane-associated phospholipid phosphatase